MSSSDFIFSRVEPENSFYNSSHIVEVLSPTVDVLSISSKKGKMLHPMGGLPLLSKDES